MTQEPCPPDLDADGQSLWKQCDFILGGGVVSPSAALQLQALAIKRELQVESRANRLEGLLRRVLEQHAEPCRLDQSGSGRCLEHHASEGPCLYGEIREALTQ